MQTEKLVFSSLFKKEELATQKIELANINDFLKFVDNAEYLLNEFNKTYDDLINSKILTVNNGELYIKSLNNVMDVSNDLSAKFKEIGLDWTGTPEYKRFKSLMTKGDRGTIQTMVGKIKNI